MKSKNNRGEKIASTIYIVYNANMWHFLITRITPVKKADGFNLIWLGQALWFDSKSKYVFRRLKYNGASLLNPTCMCKIVWRMAVD